MFLVTADLSHTFQNILLVYYSWIEASMRYFHSLLTLGLAYNNHTSFFYLSRYVSEFTIITFTMDEGDE